MAQMISKLTLFSVLGVLGGSLYFFHRSNDRRKHWAVLLVCTLLLLIF